MKVIEKGKDWAKRLKCKGCKAVLEADHTDLRYHLTDLDLSAQQYNEDIEGSYFVVCPECDQHLSVNKKDIPTTIKEIVRNINK